MAAAKYIFLSGESEVLGLFDIRPETKVVQLWNETFPVMKSGYASKRVSGGLLDDYLKETMLHNEYSLVASASDELGEIYAEAFRYTAPENIKSLGSAATDVLFDRSYRKHAKKKLTEAFPQAKGKKIIFYNPLRRETITRPKRAVFLDCKYMREYLIKDYVLVYSCEMTGRRQPDTIAYIRDFAIDATSALKVSELMACADMMIGDYLPSVFEFACTGRPVMLYAPDRFTYLYGKELNFDYDRIAPGPVFTSVEELTEAILDIDNYDDSRRKNFRDTYLSACDGHAAERIVETIL
jgi:CDP-ribitol ribitolphosphotransferase